MLRSPFNIFRTGRSSPPSPTDRTPPSSPGTSPRTSPTHSDLSPRGSHGNEATRPLLRPRDRNNLERLTRAIGQLGGHCRELLRLKLEGKSFAEIRKAMGAGSLNTVYTWDHRCRQQLMEAMGGDWEAEK